MRNVLLLLLGLAALALLWRRACREWPEADPDVLLRVWRHDVEHLSDAQLQALATGLRRQVEAL